MISVKEFGLKKWQSCYFAGNVKSQSFPLEFCTNLETGDVQARAHNISEAFKSLSSGSLVNQEKNEE